MSAGWSKLLDVDPLADGRAEIGFEIPLSEFPRLSPQLARTDGEASGRVRFSREAGLPFAEVEVAVNVTLTCQRCLEPMVWELVGRDRVAMVNEKQADQAPPELETILAPEGRISLIDLVEEELLLSLPIVPVHEPNECSVKPVEAADEADEPAEGRQRPFEQLGELLKRDP